MKKRIQWGSVLLLAALMLLLLLPLGSRAADQARYVVRFRSGAEQAGSGPFAGVDEAELRRLLAADALEWYEEDWELGLPDASAISASAPAEDVALLQEDTAQAPAWQLALIGAPRDAELGKGVRVAVIDSGADAHPALEGRLAPGWNYVDGNADTSDGNGHGTAVCGLIAGCGEQGPLGAAPGAELVPLKCFAGETGKVSLVCEALAAAVDKYDCDVINLSLSVSVRAASRRALEEAVAYAQERGAVIVAAVGNGGTATVYYPAGLDGVIGVGSVDRSGLIYYRSNHNESVFLTAPGVDVESLARDGGYARFTGTSFAAPFVTGAAAALKSLRPGLDAEALRGLLAANAADRGLDGYDPYYGNGVLHLGRCLNALLGTEGPCLSPPAPGETRAIVRNGADAPLEARLIGVSYDPAGRQKVEFVTPLTLEPWQWLRTEVPAGDWKLFLVSRDGFAPLCPALSAPAPRGTG